MLTLFGFYGWIEQCLQTFVWFSLLASPCVFDSSSSKAWQSKFKTYLDNIWFMTSQNYNYNILQENLAMKIIGVPQIFCAVIVSSTSFSMILDMSQSLLISMPWSWVTRMASFTYSYRTYRNSILHHDLQLRIDNYHSPYIEFNGVWMFCRSISWNS